MTVIHYSSSSDSDSDFGFKDYEETIKTRKEDIFKRKEFFNTTETSNKSLLPAPKKKLNAPPPPKPIEVIQPVVGQAKKDIEEDEEVIEVDAKDLHQKDLKLAEDNAMVKDKTMYNGVGRQRNKSQLTYLSKIYENDMSGVETKSRIAKSKANAARMYGW